MRLRAFAATALALSLAAGAAALAETAAGPSAKSAMLADHSFRASKLLHAPVYNSQGEVIGTVDDILVDPSSGAARAVLAIGKYTGKPGDMVAVPLGHVETATGQLMMPNATQEHLGAMSKWHYEFDLGGGH